jgi:hypothetical protein
VSGHTPGPWTVEPESENYQVRVNSADWCIADVWGDRDELANQYRANGHLIAAAPDLLAELKHLVRLMEPKEQTGLDIPGLATLNGARAAIAKAAGNSAKPPAADPDLLAALKSVIAILFNTPGRTMTDAESAAFWAAIAVIRKVEDR